ncbi:MAG: alanine racemase [Propionibacteriales bacterium]|nr:alanine racemase [Propionibacteriales bacterium]
MTTLRDSSRPRVSEPTPRAEAVVDLRAIRDNVATLRARAEGRPLMAVVKADGYGHGLVEAAAAARAGGAEWIGVAVLEEAMALRAAGDTGPMLSWLAVPGEDVTPAIAAGVELSAYSRSQLAELLGAARSLGQVVHLQLKVDTGLNRGGIAEVEWRELFADARAAERAGEAAVTGLWSHMACGDEPDHHSVPEQIKRFAQAVALAEDAGLRPGLRHLANSPTLFTQPGAWWDMVRPGLSIYGLSPIPDQATAGELGLTPALTLRTSLALVKPVPAGQGVSYGHTHVTQRDTVLGLVPLGYADGIPRHASNAAEVWVAGRRRPVVGRVCMDQFMVDLGPETTVRAGAEVVVFGAGRSGEPTAQDWADAAGTISYEIVSRLGGRITRTFVGLDS